MSMAKGMVRNFFAVALLGVAAVPASAQVPGVSFTVVPSVGYFAPLSSLGDAAVAGEAKLDGALTIGLSAELGVPALPFGIRANLEHVLDAKMEQDDPESGEGSITMVTGDIVFGGPRLLPVRPYLLVGAGVKRYDFDTTESDFTGHVGGGVDVKFGPIGFVAEVSDYISQFEFAPGETKLQNDVVARLGFRVGMF